MKLVRGYGAWSCGQVSPAPLLTFSGYFPGIPEPGQAVKPPKWLVDTGGLGRYQAPRRASMELAIRVPEARVVHEHKEQLIRAALGSLREGQALDERETLELAEWVAWYDRVGADVTDIKNLAGAIEIELAIRRGQKGVATKGHAVSESPDPAEKKRAYRDG